MRRHVLHVEPKYNRVIRESAKLETSISVVRDSVMQNGRVICNHVVDDLAAKSVYGPLAEW